MPFPNSTLRTPPSAFYSALLLPPQLRPGFIAALCLLLAGVALLLFTGCAYVRVYDEQRHAGFSSMMPSWPWQDSTRVLDRMNVSSKTNSFTASVRGLNDSETTSTNTVSAVAEIVSAAVRAAVKP